MVQQFENILKTIAELGKTELFPTVDFNLLDDKHLQISEVETMSSECDDSL